MPDPLTPNKFLAQPTRGSDTGVWDTPMNNNTGIVDNSFGGVATIALTNSPVTLSAAQYQCAFIKLTGAITANVALTFPGGIGSFYTILNQTTNSSAFVVTMTTSAAGAQTIGLPAGENTKVLLDGTNPQFHGLPHVGSYMHFGFSSSPQWITSCTIPPYLNCDGTTFSSGTYPALTAYLAGTTLPDTRGRTLFATDQGTGRTAGATFLQGGGNVNQTITAANLPAHSHPVSDPGHSHGTNVWQTSGGLQVVTGASPTNVSQGNTATATTGLTVSNSTYANSALNITPPFLIHGITMIRAG